MTSSPTTTTTSLYQLLVTGKLGFFFVLTISLTIVQLLILPSYKVDQQTNQVETDCLAYRTTFSLLLSSPSTIQRLTMRSISWRWVLCLATTSCRPSARSLIFLHPSPGKHKNQSRTLRSESGAKQLSSPLSTYCSAPGSSHSQRGGCTSMGHSACLQSPPPPPL